MTEAQTLIDCDTIRVYRVDDEAGTCEPIAFKGQFAGREDPGLDRLRVRIGQGLTGWVAAQQPDRPHRRCGRGPTGPERRVRHRRPGIR